MNEAFACDFFFFLVGAAAVAIMKAVGGGGEENEKPWKGLNMQDPILASNIHSSL